MAEIDKMMGILKSMKSADISVNPQRCVTVRNRRATCHRCADACTSKAITIEGNSFVINNDDCVGCGTCATLCPTCALEAQNPNDNQLLSAVTAATAAAGGVAVIACRQIVDAAGKDLDTTKVVGVECLGRVEESLLATLAAAGVERTVLVKGPCATCEHAVGLETVKTVMDTLETLFGAWSQPMGVELVERFPGIVRATEAADHDDARRNFFFKTSQGMRRAAVAAGDAVLSGPGTAEEEPADVLMKVMDDGTLPHFIPDRRERLLDALAELGEPEDVLVNTRLWGHVIIDTEKCNSCRMCATFCPTGAIRKFDEGDEMGIDHFPGDCVKCRCCENICPANALSISDEVFAVDLLTGAAERIVMKKPFVLQSNPKKALFIMRDLLGCDDIYER